MRIEDLEIFADVARHHSINIAAEKHFMTSQNVSKIIKNMEKDLDTVLFNRSTKGSELTIEGERFYLKVLNVLKEYTEALESIHISEPAVEKKEAENVDLKVFCTQGAIYYALINTRKEMLKDFDIYLDLHIIDSFNPKKMKESVPEEPYDLLTCGFHATDIDFFMKEFPNYIPLHIIYDEYVLLLSKKHPLANRAIVSVEEFKNLNLLLPKENYLYHEFGDTDLRCAMVMNSINMIIEQVEQSDDFCTLVCKSLMKSNKNLKSKDNLCTIPLDRKVHTVYLIMVRDDLNNSKPIQEFCKRLAYTLNNTE